MLDTQLPQFYQVVRRASPIHSGIMLIPLVVTQTITSFTSGFIVSKTGNYRVNLWFGFAVWTVACGLLSTISPTTSNAKLVGYQMLSGIGAGQTFQTSLIAIQASVKRSEMAVATGMRNFLRMLGGTVALAACAAILNNTAKSVPSQVSCTSANVLVCLERSFYRYYRTIQSRQSFPTLRESHPASLTSLCQSNQPLSSLIVSVDLLPFVQSF